MPRTTLTARDLQTFVEDGPSTKTFTSLDVADGNRIVLEPHLAVVFFNSAGSSKTVTYSYDDDAGSARTKVLTLAAGEVCPVQLPARLARHTGDADNGIAAWFTANGTAGDVKAIAVRTRPLA